MTSFFERLTSVAVNRNSLLCVGLDPRLADRSRPRELLEANRRVIGETAEVAACFKPNIAFYEAAGPAGLEMLLETLELIPDELPVIIDAKRGDIGSTAEAYAASLFDVYGADAVTLSPYLGRESAAPFLAYGDRGLFFVCRTSNPGAERLQRLVVTGETGGERQELYLSVARECLSWGEQAALVVAGNDPGALASVRRAFPQAWLLAPGIGAQGGSAQEAVIAGVRADGFGILPVVVRAIADDANPGKSARAYRDAINSARESALDRASGDARARTAAADREPERSPVSTPDVREPERAPAPGAPTAAATGSDHGTPRSARGERAAARRADPALRDALLAGLIESECFKLGSFVLKSGITSPFYIDLRRAASEPSLLRLVARAYASLLDGIAGFDRIAGIPVAALPIATAVSLETGIPLIYPRMSAKGHGTGNAVEGIYRAGDRVVLLDDLITTGQSKLEAAAVLRDAGLLVTEIVVLLERGVQGRRELGAAGIALHAYAQVSELFGRCRALGLIDETKERELLRFVERNS